MKKTVIFFFILFFFSGRVFSQLDDILKKVPGVSDVLEEAVTTSIKDAYPSAYWLG
jgi:Na+/phosphate symporter